MSFMPAAFRVDLLEDVGRLHNRLEASPPKNLEPATRMRTLYMLGWGYSLTQECGQGPRRPHPGNRAAPKLGVGVRCGNELLESLAACHNLIANLLCQRNAFAMAEPHYLEAIRLRSEEMPPDFAAQPDSRRALGECLIDQARSVRNLKRDAEARKLYLNALAIFKELVERDPERPQYIRDLAVAWADLGNCDMSRGWDHQPSSDEREQAVRAREELETAVRTYDRLQPDPESSPRIATERALCFKQISKISAGSADSRRPSSWLREKSKT